MNDKQMEALRAIGGDDLVDLVVKTGENHTKELEAENVAHKAVDEKASYAARIKACADSIEDEALKKQVMDFAAKLEQAYPYPKPKAKKPEEEEEPKAKKPEEEEGYPKPGKKEAESEAGEAEDEKANKMQALAQQLKMLAGKVGGKAGTDLRKVADDMAALVEKYAKPKKSSKEDLSRDEVGEALKSLVEFVQEQVGAIRAEQKQMTNEVAEAIKPLAEAVKALQLTDEQKIAQKAAQVPEASLKSIVESVIGSDATYVDGRTKEAKDGPKETPPDEGAGPTPVPGINQWIMSPND